MEVDGVMFELEWWDESRQLDDSCRGSQIVSWRLDPRLPVAEVREVATEMAVDYVREE